MCLRVRAGQPSHQDSHRVRAQQPLRQSRTAITSKQDSSEAEWVPKCPTYPLYSKFVKREQLQQLTGLLTTGTIVVTRQLYEGKQLRVGERGM